MNRVTAMLIAVLTIFLLFGVTYYQGRVTTLQRDVAEITAVANQQKKDLQLIETQRQAVAAIDIKHTKELADAKSENERLRADIANGTKRLQLNATCGKGNTSATSGSPDAESPRLTADAELNYWRLRDGIATLTSQVNGLQDYVTNVCLK